MASTISSPQTVSLITYMAEMSGFHKRLFHAEASEENGPPVLRLSYTSPDGEENYPGTLRIIITYTLKPGPELVIHYQATTDQATVVNLTNHSYFNLAGHDDGSIGSHMVQIDASQVAETDDFLIPTGALLPVEHSPFDFRTATSIESNLTPRHPVIENAKGYDLAYILDPSRAPSTPVSRITHPESGRVLETITTQPALHLYTAGFLEPVTGKEGVTYQPSCAFCLETQHVADSPNQPDFPNTVLRPGETFSEETTFRFSTE